MPNLLCSHPPFQIDGNFGGAAGILEMLLQSRTGRGGQPPLIHLLPALPAALASGEARGLLARGGFQVDIRWRDGLLVEARIQSHAPRPCLVRWRARTIEAAAPVTLSPADFA